MSHVPSSHGSGHDTGEPHGHQAEDEIAYGKVITVGVVSLIIFALSTVWAAIILKAQTEHVEATSGAATRPAEIGRDEIGIVDQVPFLGDHRLAEWKAEKATHLDGYGWVNRAQGIAHIPIEKAMDAVAAGGLPAGAPR
jgi:hypothetical protein